VVYSLSPYRQTDGWTDRQRNKYTRFAWAGGTCPRFAWAGGTFFPVVLLCQFLVLAGNWQFFCCGGKVLLRPEKTKLQLSVWRVVLLCQFLVLAGNRQFFCCGGKSLLRPEKKVLVIFLVKIDLICFEHSICISST
jgi:hypothetical protein